MSSVIEETTDKQSVASFKEFLTFTLGSEEYAIDILKVQEIRGYDAVTTISNAPEFIKGVINLRGAIVPIVDFRIKFGVGVAEYTQTTVVVILNINSRVAGVVVDSVSDVVALAASDISMAPDVSHKINSVFVTGLATQDDRMMIMLDIEGLMCSHEMALIELEN